MKAFKLSSVLVLLTAWPAVFVEGQAGGFFPMVGPFRSPPTRPTMGGRQPGPKEPQRKKTTMDPFGRDPFVPDFAFPDKQSPNKKTSTPKPQNKPSQPLIATPPRDKPTGKPSVQGEVGFVSQGTIFSGQPIPNQDSNCLANCQSTSEYNPVCATGKVTYNNPGRLLCAIRCGEKRELLYLGRCRLDNPLFEF